MGHRDPVARRDHERLQPARQHGRARRDARRDRVRLLRDRRGDAAPERHRARPLALARARVHRLPARSTSVRGDRPRCSWATRGARWSGSGSRRSRSHRAGRSRERPSRRSCCRSSCSRSRSSTRLSSPPCGSLSGGRSPRAAATTRRTGSCTTGSRRRTPCSCSRSWRRRSVRTALAYNVLDNARLTAVGVLLTFVLLVQFGELPLATSRSARGKARPHRRRRSGTRSSPSRGGWSRSSSTSCSSACRSSSPTRSSSAGQGTDFERSVFLSTLPILLATQYVLFVALGVYRRVWRYATARDVIPLALGCGGAALLSSLIVQRAAPDRLVPGSRDLRRLRDALHRAHRGVAAHPQAAPRGARLRGRKRRVLIVGAGQGGARARARAPRRHEARVVGFLDDNPRVRRRRILGVTVVGALDETARAIASARPDEVLVRFRARPRSGSTPWSALPRTPGSLAGSSGGAPSSPRPSRVEASLR